MSYLDWHVGMKVVCVKRVDPRIRVKGGRYPDYRGIYTIRQIRDDKRKDGALTLLLHELDNSDFIGVQIGNRYGYLEPGFPHHGFRPLQTRKTDISIFTAMLHGAKERERA